MANYLGGSGSDPGMRIAADASGDCYVTGATDSSDFPTPYGFDTTHSGAGNDVFVAGVTPSGQLAWASYIGGSGAGYGIAVNGSGDLYLVGDTASSDFPTVGGFDTSYNGGKDGFVAKVAPVNRMPGR